MEAKNDFVPATSIADSDGQGVVWCFFVIFGESESPTRKGLGSSVHGMEETREDAILCLVAVIGLSRRDLQPGALRGCEWGGRGGYLQYRVGKEEGMMTRERRKGRTDVV